MADDKSYMGHWFAEKLRSAGDRSQESAIRTGNLEPSVLRIETEGVARFKKAARRPRGWEEAH
jgi:hypothetical protein